MPVSPSVTAIPVEPRAAKATAPSQVARTDSWAARLPRARVSTVQAIVAPMAGWDTNCVEAHRASRPVAASIAATDTARPVPP